MGWKEVKVEEQRLNFIDEYIVDNLSFTALCEAYNISRKTGYKWLERFYENGKEGLQDLSRAPHSNARELAEDITNAILVIKKTYPHWGAKKIHVELQKYHAHLRLPSINSVGNVLERFGLVAARRYRRRVPDTAPLAHCVEANSVWSCDFKGWFLTGDGKKCEPLTMTDGHTRYLLRCVPMKRKGIESVWAVFDAAFREYGLPLRMRSDNGPPFAAPATGRLSSLSILLIKAGVVPEWISPGKPQENGRHERFHLTLKNETATPPAATLEAQARDFLKFQNYYNHKRPHEALGQQTPGSLYTPSERKWNGRLRSPEYPDSYMKRKVMKCGRIAWHGEDLFISESLYGEYVGLLEQANGQFEVHYGPILLGTINEKCQFEKFKRKQSC